MDKSDCNKSAILGKSFEYWKNLQDKGVIDKHVIHLRLVHLKYAVDQNLISIDEYYVHRLSITDKFSPSSAEYRSCTLMDFGKALNARGLATGLELNQPLDRQKILDERKNVASTFEKVCRRNETAVNLKCNPDKGQESNNQIRTSKKSKRKRKKKRKRINNYCTNINNDSNNTEINHCVRDKCYSHVGNSTKQIIMSKDPVKIFVRPVNKKYQSAENTNQKPLNISSKRSVREIFSKILKQFKEEKKLQC